MRGISTASSFPLVSAVGDISAPIVRPVAQAQSDTMVPPNDAIAQRALPPRGPAAMGQDEKKIIR